MKVRSKTGLRLHWWNIMLRIYSHSCAYCERYIAENYRKPNGSWTLDHYVAINIGGSNRLENLVPCCRWCNCSKGTSTPKQWLAKMDERGLDSKRFLELRDQWCSAVWAELVPTTVSYRSAFIGKRLTQEEFEKAVDVYQVGW